MHSDASSSAFTPGGTVVGLGTPTPGSTRENTPGGTATHPLSGLMQTNGEASLEVLLALRKLQEENEALQRENSRLKEQQQQVGTPIREAANGEMARGDVTMSC